jgi:GntR family transcriptional regulator
MTFDGIRGRGSSASLYEQVRRDLLQRIADGEFKPGDLLPTEEALCKEYGVSHITVRRAVADLAANYFVTRKRGLGTVVTRRVSDRRVFRFSGFFSDTPRFESTELSSKVEPASDEVSEALHIESGTLVRHIQQIAHRSGEVFTLTNAYTVEPVDANGNATGTGARRLGLRVVRGEQELGAVNADAFVAKHLGISPGRPIMFALRILLDTDDKPVRYSISNYHPDRYRFAVDLRPSRDGDIFEPLSASPPAEPSPVR